MMSKAGNIVLILAFSIFALAGTAQASSDFVKVSLERDGKPIEQKFKILIYTKYGSIEPLRFENGFVVPPEIKDLETVNVRILFGKYNILYESVTVGAFTTDWVVGVDNKPFDTSYVNSEDMESTKIVYYIRFVSRHGQDKILVLRVLKNNRRVP